jgi:hypothetical protein
LRKFLYLLFLFLISCKSDQAIPIIDIGQIEYNEEIQIKDWRVAGFFPTGGSTSKFSITSLDVNDLNKIDMVEDSLTSANFLKIDIGKIESKYNLPDNIINNIVHSNDYYIDFKNVFKGNSKKLIGNVYLCCEIESAIEQKVVFLTGSNDGMKIWLNKKLLYKIDIPRQIQKYQDFIPVDLKKGKNFLLVKVNNRGGDWYFRLGISSIEYAEKKYSVNIISNFLENSLLKKGENLKFNINLFTQSHPFKIIISDNFHNIVSKTDHGYLPNPKISLNNFKEGLYLCRLIFPSYTFEQKFYYGNIKKKFNTLKKYATRIKNKNEQTKINIDALTFRFEHLLHHHMKYSDGWDPWVLQQWQKKLIYIAFELESIIIRFSAGKDPFKNHPGTHIRGYRSIIDNQIQHDLISIPSGYKDHNEPLPLVIQIPVFSEKPRPFLEGYPLADISRIEVMSALAEKHGYAILWPSARILSKINIHPIGITAIFEAIENLKLDYKIDMDRIYLYGVCSGARAALLFGARFPSMFAAIGLDRPLFDISHTLPIAAKQWAEANNMFNFPENLFITPIYIIHGEKDTHAPFEQTVKFVKLCNKIGISPKFDVLKGVPTHLFYNESLQKIFAFFKNKERVKEPYKITFSTTQLKYNRSHWLSINQIVPLKKSTINAEIKSNNRINIETQNVYQFEIYLDNLNFDKTKPIKIETNGELRYNDIPKNNSIIINIKELKDESKVVKNNVIEGPIMDAFSGKFIVVEGTNGSEQELSVIHRRVVEFCNAWKNMYFVNCLLKKDIEINNQDIQNSHLILFGNQKTNMIIDNIIEHIPLKIEKDRIIIGQNEYLGSKLSFHMIYPNPLNPQRYIVIIGANNINYFQLGESDLSLNGWHDFVVREDPFSKKYFTGYFDRFWE